MRRIGAPWIGGSLLLVALGAMTSLRSGCEGPFRFTGDGPLEPLPAAGADRGIREITAIESIESSPDDPARERATVELQVQAVRLIVRDSRGAPIEGAVVFLLREMSAQELARTGLDGSASLARSRLPEQGLLKVAATGHATELLDVPGPARDLVEIVLRDGGRISGEIRTPGGEPADSGLRVTAVPAETFHAPERTRREELKGRFAWSGLTGDDASFSIEGLREGAVYWLEVADESGESRTGGQAIRVVASSSGVLLTAFPLYGVLLEFTCRDEAYLERFFRRPATRRSSPPQFAFVADWDPALRRSAGTRALASDCRFCLSLVYLLHAASVSERRTVRCEGTIPGFETFHAELELGPLCEDRLPVHAIELVPNAEGGGTVELELLGDSARLLAEKGAKLLLDLHRVENGQKLSFPVAFAAGETIAALTDVPAGAYRWGATLETGKIPIVESPAKDGVGTDAPVVLVDGGTVRLELRAPEVAYLEVECHDAASQVTGLIQLANGPIYTSNGTATWIRGIVCRASPEVIGPLSPGHYDVVLVEPRPLPEGALGIELGPGEVLTLVIAVP